MVTFTSVKRTLANGGPILTGCKSEGESGRVGEWGAHLSSIKVSINTRQQRLPSNSPSPHLPLPIFFAFFRLDWHNSRLLVYNGIRKSHSRQLLRESYL